MLRNMLTKGLIMAVATARILREACVHVVDPAMQREYSVLTSSSVALFWYTQCIA
jgi:hypothetical protein